VTHVECTVCGRRHEAGQLLTVCAGCGQMLAVRYDLPRVAASVTKDALRQRPPGMYRFRELLPLGPAEAPVDLGEGGTALLPLPRLAAHLGMRHLWAKDEGQNPTGSFKARGLGMAVTKARSLGVKGLMIPSAGNAGGAAAAYGARAGVPVVVVVPRGTPEAAVAEAVLAGAHVFTVDGSIATAGKLIAQVAPRLGWFDLATLKEPYRLEGKKTMGLELAEQMGWETPDYLMYPTGGGTGSSASGRRTTSWPPSDGSRPGSRPSSPSRPRGARPWSRPGRTARTSRRCGRTRSPMRRACACPARSPAGRC
jgi:threonine synthase